MSDYDKSKFDLNSAAKDLNSYKDSNYDLNKAMQDLTKNK